MYGDGPDVSIIRESANKGGDTGATACKMLYITATGTNVAESVTVRDLTFDKNGANTPLPSPDTKYEKAHTIAINIKNTAVLRNAWFENLVMLDRIGGHIVLAEGRINSAVIIGCHARNANYTGSPRGDIEFKRAFRTCRLTAVPGISCNQSQMFQALWMAFRRWRRLPRAGLTSSTSADSARTTQGCASIPSAPTRSIRCFTTRW